MPEVLLAPFHAVGQLIIAGGPLVLWILLAGILMWTLIFERLWFFQTQLSPMVTGLLADWKGRPEHQSWASHQVRKAMISRLNGAMAENMPVLKVLIPMCPLLGLVGTVHGMLEVFDSMAILGSADARTMASGVSKAMNCTMTGLAVSVTGMYPVFHFQSAIRKQTELLADRFTF
ncbi:MotA/TolQ/ExbB proton channel family protein [Solimonas sp. K1W22B-7]|uniref:MotA/TolQ/ExbB proton channel family protein n=1 Tax=Solimonas sp. K1W22B-7 TaxID=2303331 RepID=UPI000E32ED6D|nr:MotA/TolQ/ExbB proton channel family protein [Solimonas sp. K1W22B-7]AXQ30706.1 MotA/TolQ/ExbB proton channel family protein [Solimonas sp. K1W22B-7]